ncbi:MAG: hypothetical protein SFW67_11445 [Myxococcaceae bacterium]|nr:hypothetical protein [Myxococcaceae bacterium]
MKSPTVERLTWVRDELRPWARRFFDEHRDAQSVLLAAAQYWADEADDAVHLFAWTSTERVPDFFARDWDERSTGSTRGVDWQQRPQWDDNGSAIRRFQAYCGEGGSQELPTSSQAEPFALLQRDGNEVRLHWLGRCVRPWLDLPHTAPGGYQDDEEAAEDADLTPDGTLRSVRSTVVLPAQALHADDLRCLDVIAKDPFAEGPRRVWADLWLSRHDPRGSFMQSRHADLDAFLEHAEFWLGELNQVVPLGSAGFEFGSLASAEVFFDEQRRSLAESPWWQTVHTLRFSGDEQLFGSTMRALRHVSGLSAVGLMGLEDFTGTSRLESLHAEVSEAELDLLWSLPLSSLSSLSLTWLGGAGFERLRPPSSWRSLKHLRVSVPWAPTYEWDGEDDAGPAVELPSVTVLRETNPSLERVSVSSADSSQLPSGYELSLDASGASLTMLRLGPTARREVLHALVDGLPAKEQTVTLVERPWFQPTSALLAKHPRRPTVRLASS